MRLLVLTNDTAQAPAPGMRDGYASLERAGEIDSVQFISWKEAAPDDLLQHVATDSYDALIVWSPRSFPDEAHEAKLHAAIAERPIFIWEGDHWAARRLAPAARRFWLPRASIVFNSAGLPVMKSFLRAGASRVVSTVSGYDHVRFERAEMVGPTLPDRERSVVMIASNPPTRAGRIMRPGAISRRTLAGRLRADLGEGFNLYGGGWPTSWRARRVPFDEQIRTIREHELSVIWDHYPKLPFAISNRMAISLLAGRPHIMTLHPGANWLARQAENGLFMEGTVAAVQERVRELRALPSATLWAVGNNAWDWARYRLSQRELVRYIVSHIASSVTPPSQEPWTTLLGRGVIDVE